MKKIEVRSLKAYNAFIATLLAILGFTTSCKDYLIRTEYGTPSAKFIVNGKIESSVSNTAIENIRVIMHGDTTFTDGEGKYQVSDKYGFPRSQIYDIKFQDIDGSQNGEFENFDTVVEFKDPSFINGDGHWYQGEISKELNVTLNPKE